MFLKNSAFFLSDCIILAQKEILMMKQIESINRKLLILYNKLSLNYKNAKFYEDCIFIENASHIGIAFDGEQNIMGIGKISVINNENYNKLWIFEERRKYQELIGLPYPFYLYTIKDIVDMASNIHIEEKDGNKNCT